jgi:hypothetical protein
MMCGHIAYEVEAPQPVYEYRPINGREYYGEGIAVSPLQALVKA